MTATISTAASSTDRQGNAVKDWATAVDVEAQVWIDQQNRSENQDRREGQVGSWIAVFPDPDTVLAAGDRVTVDGRVFEVDGPPWTVTTLAGPHHVEATLRWVQG